MKQNLHSLLCYTACLLALIGCEKPATDPLDKPDEEKDKSNFVYTSDISGKFEIWKSEEGKTEKLTDSKDKENWWPRISPDASEMIFYKSPKGSELQNFKSASLWKMDLNTRGESQIFESRDQGWSYEGEANWSPDGEKFVFSALMDSLGTWQIFISDKDGNHAEKISTRNEFDYLNPVFSIDGKSVFCSIIPDGEPVESLNFEIFELEVDTKIETRLTHNKTSDHHPHVNPDGTKIAFESLTDPNYLQIGKWNVMELDLATMKESILINTENLSFYPRYSTDGAFLFYINLDIAKFKTSIFKFDLGDQTNSEVLADTANFMNVDPF